MARKLRIEYEGARYHVINRGNYLADVFETDGAKEAFEGCLYEACASNGVNVTVSHRFENHGGSGDVKRSGRRFGGSAGRLTDRARGGGAGGLVRRLDLVFHPVGRALDDEGLGLVEQPV